MTWDCLKIEKGGIYMKDYLSIANSPILYIGVAALLIVVTWQSAVYIRKALARAEELNIPKEKLRRAMRTAAVVSIVPSIAIVIALLTLAPVLGTPISWGRLSIIGNLSYELFAANIGAESAGVALGGADYTATAFLTSVTTMTIGSFAMLGITILGFKKYKTRLNRSLDKEGKREDNPWARVLLAALIVSLYARFLAEPVAHGGVMLITMLVSAACAFLLGLLVKRVQSLKWMNDFVLSISMIVGMIAAVLVS